MGREEQRASVRRMRESLIEELEGVYRRAFDAIGSDDMGEGAVARLTHARAATSITAARAILPLDGHSLHTQSVPVTQIRKRLFAVTIHNTIYGHFGFVKR